MKTIKMKEIKCYVGHKLTFELQWPKEKTMLYYVTYKLKCAYNANVQVCTTMNELPI